MKKPQPIPRMNEDLILLLAATLAGGLLAPADLSAMGGTVRSPVVVVAKPGRPGDVPYLNFPSPDQNRIRLFEDFEEAFAGGYFINAMTRLYFIGDAGTLNRMLEELAGTEGVHFTIRFARTPIVIDRPFEPEDGRPESPRTAPWMVQHNGGSQLSITIHAGEGGIAWESLRLPELTGCRLRSESSLETFQ